MTSQEAPVGAEAQADELYTRIALDNKLVTRFQLRKATEEQETAAKTGARSPIGDVMVKLGFLSERQHQSVVNAVRYREQRDYDKRIGRQCLRMNLLEQTDIEKALEVQKDGYQANGAVKPLADVLVTQKRLTQKQVDEVKRAIEDRDKHKTGKTSKAAGPALGMSGPTPVLGGGKPASKPAGKKKDEDDDDLDADLDDDDLDDADLDDADLDDADLDDADLADLEGDDDDDGPALDDGEGDVKRRAPSEPKLPVAAAPAPSPAADASKTASGDSRKAAEAAKAKPADTKTKSDAKTKSEAKVKSAPPATKDDDDDDDLDADLDADDGDDDDGDDLDLDGVDIDGLDDDDASAEDEDDLADDVSELGSDVELDEEDIKALDEIGSGDGLQGEEAWAAEAFDDRPMSARPGGPPPPPRPVPSTPNAPTKPPTVPSAPADRSPAAASSARAPKADTLKGPAGKADTGKAPATPGKAPAATSKADGKPLRTAKELADEMAKVAATASSPFESAEHTDAPPPPPLADIPGGDTLDSRVTGAGSSDLQADTAKAEPAKAEPAKAEPAKAEPAKAEAAKVEPKKGPNVGAAVAKLMGKKSGKADAVAKAEPAKTEEPAKVEPVRPAAAAAKSEAKLGRSDEDMVELTASEVGRLIDAEGKVGLGDLEDPSDESARLPKAPATPAPATPAPAATPRGASDRLKSSARDLADAIGDDDADMPTIPPTYRAAVTAAAAPIGVGHGGQSKGLSPDDPRVRRAFERAVEKAMEQAWKEFQEELKRL